MVTAPWSENSPLQGIKFPRGGSSGVENGLNNLGWDTWVYQLGPLRGQAHSFHSSGWGWNIEPPAWDRRSLLTQEAPEEARRGGILYLGTILCPATAGQWEVVEPGPGELSPVLPGAERSGEKHTDEASATSVPLHPVREELDAWHEGKPEWTVRRLLRHKQVHLGLAELPPYQLHHLGVEPPFPGPQPLSRQDVCLYIVGPGM